MFITHAQAHALDSFPRQYDDGWSIYDNGDDRLRVELEYDGASQGAPMHWTARQYTRYLTPGGVIERWDDGKGGYVDATGEPKFGTYKTKYAEVSFCY